jgi:PAS domain S-box-containing protein
LTLRRDEIEDGGLHFTGKLGFWEADPSTGSLEWSGDVEDILGLPRGRTQPSIAKMLDLVVPEEREAMKAALQSSIDNRFQHHHIEVRCQRPDGRELVVRNEWRMEADEAGKPVLRGVIEDVTHRRRAKAALRRRTALLELLYAVAACANEAESPEQALQVSLERICAFGGWPVGYVLSLSDGEPRELCPTGLWHTWDELRFSALRAAVGRIRYPVRIGGDPPSQAGPQAGPRSQAGPQASPRAPATGVGAGTLGSLALRGKPVWSTDLRGHGPLPAVEAAVAAGLRAAFDLPVLVGAETVAVIECFSEDDRPPDQDLMEAMPHVAAQLGRVFERKKVERMKDEFVSVVSHELRTPLTSIQGAIGLLENGVLGPLSGEALEMARIASEGCARLLRLVNELLDIQKLEVGSPSFHSEPLRLGPIVEEAVTASRPYAASLGIRIEIEDRAPGAVVLADGDRLTQVVSNLLSNAIKYTPVGERVLITARRVSGQEQGPTSGDTRGYDGGSAPKPPPPPQASLIRVAVEDRGPGVPEAFRRRLFRKFSQADASDARQKAGTGLGLAICKVIVEKLGGTIAHEHVAGGGARFYFELPELPPMRPA